LGGFGVCLGVLLGDVWGVFGDMFEVFCSDLAKKRQKAFKKHDY
jgi:hypothetical protein